MAGENSPTRIATLVLAACTIAAAGCGGTSSDTGAAPAAGRPASIVVVSGSQQTGTVGKELPDAVVVRVLDPSGNPIANQLISFHVTEGGGSMFAGASITNADGQARDRWRLGTRVSDVQSLEARAVDNSTGQAIVFASFSATAVADAPAAMVAASGDGQSAVLGHALVAPCVVRVADQYGNPVPGRPIDWTVVAGEGVVSPASSTTDASGQAATSWTLGTSVRTQTLRASSGSLTFSFSATGLSGAPASLVIASGDGQSATVSTRLRAPPSVLVRDAAGNPIAGVRVTFAVMDGGGSVTPSTSETANDGLATTEWTLGAVVGTNHLRASIAELASSVTFSATGKAVAGTPASITKAAGDGQVGAPGSTLAVAPVVQVKDAYGAAVAGVPVAFAVTLGGGRVQFATGVTDSVGKASCGAWVLGSTKGLNAISATVADLGPVSFSAQAKVTSPDVTVSVLAPSAGEVVGEAVSVVASVTSTYQLASVTASAGANTVALTYGAYGRWGSPAWAGTLSLAGQARGAVGIVFSATDAFGNVTDAVVSVSYDRAPVVSVASPLDGSVARPTVDVVATCTDDDPVGCKSLTVTVNGKTVASGKDSISQVVDLSTSEGTSVSVVVSGVDSINQTTSVTRTVHVESSPRLILKAEIEGVVWDAADTRVLYVDQTGAIPALKVRNTSTGATDVVETSSDLVGTWGGYGFLTPVGAIYAHGIASNSSLADYPWCWAYEWRGGSVSKLGGLNSCGSLVVAGKWAIYSTQTYGPNIPVELWRRDLVAGTSILVSNVAGNTNNDVAENGDVVYWSSHYWNGPNWMSADAYNVFRYRGGTSVALTSDSSAKTYNTYPVTDGTNVVFHKGTPTTSQVVLSDGSTPTVLTSNPGSVYATGGGYVAFGVVDMASATQIWRRSPEGVNTQLTFFGSSSTINAIGPDGSVVLTNGGKRYLAAPGAVLQQIGSALGSVVVRNGQFLVLLGRDVLQVGTR